ncbi:MAG: DUF3054 domain-containing protein [Chloroflexi bacterium]|nr:DUF3054 domain-containing protein [Chloroflexota bacterium]
MEHAPKTTIASLNSSLPQRHKRGFLWALVAGDFAVFMLFALIGRASHELPGSDFPLMAQFITAAPFMAGWFAVSAFFGTYSPTRMSTWPLVFARVSVAWLPAEMIGLILRAFFLGRPFIFTFALVTFLIVGVMLLVWRSIFWLLILRRAHAI